jgi:hypothetical protein
VVDYDQTFSSSFSVTEAYSDPGGLREVSFNMPGALTAAPAIAIEVTCVDGLQWRGLVFGGTDDANMLANSPNPDVLVAIGNGFAYIVPVGTPDKYAAISLRPVRSILTVPTARVLVFVGYTRLLAIGAGGDELWTTQRLVADGFSEVRVVDTALAVRGWDARLDRDVETTVDLHSGAVMTRG